MDDQPKNKNAGKEVDVFLGNFEYNLDDKGRLSIPAKYRRVMAVLDEDLFILSSLIDSCLTLYPYTRFRERLVKRIEELPQFSDNVNEIRRMLGQCTTDATLDKQGRIMIPASFCEHAGIDKAVKIVGCSEKIELWNPEKYQDFFRSADAKSIKDELIQLGI